MQTAESAMRTAESAKRTRRELLALTASVVVVGAVASPAFAAPASAPADQDGKRPLLTAGGVGTRATGHNGFMEINSAGELVYWTRSGATFTRSIRGVGWRTARLITSLDDFTFVEVKTDGSVSEWRWNGSRYSEYNRGSGWQTTRLIAGTGLIEFVEVKADGSLSQWFLHPNGGLVEVKRGSGGQAARLVAGLSPGHSFVEIKDNGSLSLWNVRGTTPVERNLGGDWGTARLIAGTGPSSFVEVKTNGLLSEWVWESDRFVEYNRGQGWQTARLIG